DVHYLGEVSRLEILQQMRGAKVLICPSTWYEGFPLIIVEAYATGLPVLASDLGGLSELVLPESTGLLFRPGEMKDLLTKLAWVTANPDRILAMRRTARRRFETLYTAETNYRELIGIYD